MFGNGVGPQRGSHTEMQQMYSITSIDNVPRIHQACAPVREGVLTALRNPSLGLTVGFLAWG